MAPFRAGLQKLDIHITQMYHVPISGVCRVKKRVDLV